MLKPSPVAPVPELVLVILTISKTSEVPAVSSPISNLTAGTGTPIPTSSVLVARATVVPASVQPPPDAAAGKFVSKLPSPVIVPVNAISPTTSNSTPALGVLPIPKSPASVNLMSSVLKFVSPLAPQAKKLPVLLASASKLK